MTDPRALALKAAEIGILDDDPTSGSVYWSPTLYRILGVDAGVEPSTEAYYRLLHPEDRPAVSEAVAHAKRSPEGGVYSLEHRIFRPDGVSRWLSLRVQPFRAKSSDAAKTRVVFSITDITDWKASEEEARRNSARLGAILSIAPDAIISIDAEQRITLFNEAAERLFGYGRAEIVGRPIELLIPTRFRAIHAGNVQQFWSSAETARRMGERQNVAGLRKDGSEFPAEASIAKIEIGGERIFTVVLQDITERKNAAEQLASMNKSLEARVQARTRELRQEMMRREEAQKQLLQAQRMEAFGQLTGGIAHDFNNLLAIVIGSLELLEAVVPKSPARVHLERALNAAEMGARLTSRLLTFARRGRLAPVILNLNDQVTGLLELLRRTLGEQIDLRTSLTKEAWPALADPSEAENAILNLALNARDAMPHGGSLLIETANVIIGEEEAAAQGDNLKPGAFIRLTVTDTGDGIQPELIGKVFEPFFTTKEAGRGSGLGLSTLYGFASQSGGTVKIVSEVGKGTAVHLYLPRADDSHDIGHPSTRSDAILFSRNNETVLVVEDNPEVRETTLQRVEALGYVVEEAASGIEALTLLSGPNDIALVFTDVVMAGGMSGYELGRWVRANRPAVKVLFTSGFAPAEDIDNGEFPILSKPFHRSELAAALDAILYGDIASTSRAASPAPPTALPPTKASH